MVIFGVFRSAGILIVTVLAALAVSAVSLATDRERIPSAIMRWWGRVFVRIGGWRVHVEGLGHLPPGGAILAANHQSLVDIPLFISAIPREVRFLAKRELGRIPVFGRAMTKAGNLLVDRQDARDAVRLIRAAKDWMNRGRVVVIFPEGTRSPDGSIGEFKTGAFFLAQKTGMPLVPVFIDGGRGALPKGSLLFRPSSLVVRVLPPVAGESGVPLSRSEMARETRRRILSARAESPAWPGTALA